MILKEDALFKTRRSLKKMSSCIGLVYFQSLFFSQWAGNQGSFFVDQPEEQNWNPDH